MAGAPAVADNLIPEVPVGYERYSLYDGVPFYDGYLTDRVVDVDIDDGILRFSNYHYSRRLDPEQVKNLGADLKLEVIIGALCDNYDRMGRVILAFPERGVDSYDPEKTERIEIARFITPFMNKNKSPNEVPFVYDVDDVRQLLSDKDLIAGRDVWMEVELFGIPYAANKQIKGCANRSDVFAATVNFAGRIMPETVERSSSFRIMPSEGNVVIAPISISKCELFGNVNFNHYNPVATDTVGQTTRTYDFNVPADLSDSQITLIITNHGSDEDGEEYYRRQHLVYLDGELVSVFTPGGISCEPFRQFNTQKNGIYEAALEDPTWWTDHNNWCPGQAVPVRRIHIGALKGGDHKLMIRVPDAEFYLDDGDFRPSAYLHGVKSGSVAAPSGIRVTESFAGKDMEIRGDRVVFTGERPVVELRVYSAGGTLLEGRYNPGESFYLTELPSGQYIIVASFSDGDISYLKYLK